MTSYFCRESKEHGSIVYKRIEAVSVLDAAAQFCRQRPKKNKHKTAVVEVLWPIRTEDYDEAAITSDLITVSFEKEWVVQTTVWKG